MYNDKVLSLPGKFLFAVEAVIDVAYHAGGIPVRSSDITRRQNIPERYLEQLLQKLVRGGVLKGIRGPKGGYVLARERRRITLGDIHNALSHDDDKEDAKGMRLISASAIGAGVLKPLWQRCEEHLHGYMDTITIEDLCEETRAIGIESEARRADDYAI